jgi:hypothetical protein
MEELKIKKFSGRAEDFRTLKRQLKAALGWKDLGEYISNNPPQAPGQGAEAAEKKKFKDENHKVYSYLMLILDERSAIHIKDSVVDRDEIAA